MGYISDIQLFRDMNKNPDVYGQHIDEETKQEIEREEKEKIDSGVVESKAEKLGPTAANFEQVFTTISDFHLKPEFSDDDPEYELLQSRKKVTVEFLSKILEDVKRYVGTVNSFNFIRDNQEEARSREEYLDNIKDIDTERRAVHNRLISDLKIMIRLVNTNFNLNFDPKLRFEAERQMPDRKNLSDEELKAALDKREYVAFEKKNFLFENLPSDPQNERDFIKEWSFGLYHDLTKLNDDLKLVLNEKEKDRD